MGGGSRRRRPPLLFWVAYAYWGGVGGTVAFAAVVHAASRTLWFPREAVVAHFSLVFQGSLLFLALAFLLLLVALRRPAPEEPRPSAGSREAEFRTFLEAVAPRRRLPPHAFLAFAGTLGLALLLLAMSLWFVSGSHGVAGGTAAATNALVVFGYAGVLVLLFPGFAYVAGAVLLAGRGAG